MIDTLEAIATGAGLELFQFCRLCKGDLGSAQRGNEGSWVLLDSAVEVGQRMLCTVVVAQTRRVTG